jgi:hypothetical protein
MLADKKTAETKAAAVQAKVDEKASVVKKTEKKTEVAQAHSVVTPAKVAQKAQAVHAKDVEKTHVADVHSAGKAAKVEKIDVPQVHLAHKATEIVEKALVAKTKEVKRDHLPEARSADEAAKKVKKTPEAKLNKVEKTAANIHSDVKATNAVQKVQALQATEAVTEKNTPVVVVHQEKTAEKTPKAPSTVTASDKATAAPHMSAVSASKPKVSNGTKDSPKTVANTSVANGSMSPKQVEDLPMGSLAMDASPAMDDDDDDDASAASNASSVANATASKVFENATKAIVNVTNATIQAVVSVVPSMLKAAAAVLTSAPQALKEAVVGHSVATTTTAPAPAAAKHSAVAAALPASVAKVAEADVLTSAVMAASSSNKSAALASVASASAPTALKKPSANKSVANAPSVVKHDATLLGKTKTTQAQAQHSEAAEVVTLPDSEEPATDLPAHQESSMLTLPDTDEDSDANQYLGDSEQAAQATAAAIAEPAHTAVPEPTIASIFAALPSDPPAEAIIPVVATTDAPVKADEAPEASTQVDEDASLTSTPKPAGVFSQIMSSIGSLFGRAKPSEEANQPEEASTAPESGKAFLQQSKTQTVANVPDVQTQRMESARQQARADAAGAPAISDNWEKLESEDDSIN